MNLNTLESVEAEREAQVAEGHVRAVIRAARAVESAFARLALRPRWSMALVAAVSLAASVGVSMLRQPVPFVHDELSYLLAADTFARGRLANPPHPHWEFFETFHVIQRPSYASKYPPGQGLALAAGRVLTGWPIAGAWGSTALACAATLWMLRGWTRPRWALAGGLLFALHPLMIQWSQSFWGGSVAALGGALALGALPRLIRSARFFDAVGLGVGLAILANSRPYEGAVLGLIVGAVGLRWSLRRGSAVLARAAGTVLAGAGPVLILAGLAMGAYNRAVTGSPLRMPYAVHEDTYALAPAFLVQPARSEPEYRHGVIARFYRACAEDHRYFREDPFRNLSSRKLGSLTPTALPVLELRHLARGPGLLIDLLRPFPFAVLQLPLLAWPCLWFRRGLRLPLAMLGAFGAALLPQTWNAAHYAAPAASLLMLATIEAARRLRATSVRGRRVGLWVVRPVLLGYVAWLVPLAVATYGRSLADAPGFRVAHAERPRVLEALSEAGGRHVVFVDYGPEHRPFHDYEWVYNGADIDAAEVVWARDMGPERNRTLLEYYGTARRPWRLRVGWGEAPVRLTPYGTSEAPGVRTDAPCAAAEVRSSSSADTAPAAGRFRRGRCAGTGGG